MTELRETIDRKLLSEAPSWSPNGRVLVFYRETKAGSKGEGFSAKLWSIDITGYNERRLKN